MSRGRGTMTIPCTKCRARKHLEADNADLTKEVKRLRAAVRALRNTLFETEDTLAHSQLVITTIRRAEKEKRPLS